MPDWTPEELKKTLDSRDPDRMRSLVAYLVCSAIAGRARLLLEKPWYLRATRGKDDDVQEVLLALFSNTPPPDARLLRKFGSYPGFAMRPGALGAYVSGITKFVLQRSYRKYRVAWEELGEDLAMVDPSPHRPNLYTGQPTWFIELKAAVAKLPPEARELFDLHYGQHLDCPEICALLGISPDVFHARKSRLLKRLRRLLEGDEE